MPKYYIESGNVHYIVCATDCEGAALWVMHRLMDSMAHTYQQAKAEWYDEDFDSEMDPNNSDLFEQDEQLFGLPQGIPYDAVMEGLVQFDPQIQVSEIGFGRNEAGSLDTETIFHKWRQLMLAVDRLQRDEQA